MVMVAVSSNSRYEILEFLLEVWQGRKLIITSCYCIM